MTSPRETAFDPGFGPGPWALAAAAGLEPTALSDAALLDAVEVVERSLAWAASVRAGLIAEHAARGPGEVADAASDQDAEWHREPLAAVCRTSPHEAQVRTDTAVALRHRLPATAAALRCGSLPWAQAVVLARESRDLDPDGSAYVERTVLADVRAVSVGQVVAATRRAVAQIRPGIPEQQAVEAHAARSLSIWAHPDTPGLSRLVADLTTDAAAQVAAALEPLATRSGPDDDRDVKQRRADALVALAVGERPGCAEVQLVVRDTAASLDDLPVTAATARRLGCSARVTRHRVDRDGTVVVPRPTPTAHVTRHGAHHGARHGAQDVAHDGTHDDTHDGGRVGAPEADPTGRVPEAVSERRFPDAAMRRRLEARDGGCAFPGCPVRARRCHAHHIRHWADGGPTTDANLTLLCARHHRSAHEGGWRLTGPATALAWGDPHGRTYRHPPAAAHIPAWSGDPPLV